MPTGYYPNQMGLGQIGQNPYVQHQPQSQPAAWQTGARPGGAPQGGGGGGYTDPLVQHQNVGLQAGMNPTLAPTPQSWQPPQLPQAVSLADLIAPGNTFPFEALGYGSQNWNIPQFGSPAGAVGWGGGQGGMGGPTQINSGIQPPQMPGLPQVNPQAAGLGGQSPMSGAATQALLPQMLAPQLAALQGQYYTGTADLGLAGQQAQAESGLGWAGLASQLQQLEQQRQQAQQNNLLGFLSRGIA